MVPIQIGLSLGNASCLAILVFDSLETINAYLPTCPHRAGAARQRLFDRNKVCLPAFVADFLVFFNFWCFAPPTPNLRFDPPISPPFFSPKVGKYVITGIIKYHML